jgi:ubiquinone/menaquinone biosynthesis C-methylase UbiE
MTLELPATAAEYFGAMADSYDDLIARAVPRYAEMSERLVDYLPGTPRRILELGCGTGNLSLRLAGRFPDAALTVVDASEDMVALTRRRLDRHAPATAARARYVVARFEALEADDGAFDLATSCIALHHVVDKGALFARVRRWLSAGGTFRFADQLRGGTEWNHALNWQRWLDLCREPGRCTEEEIASLLEHARRHDHYTSLAEHLRLLDAAGFVAPDCVWRNWIWGIVTADAPAP